MVPMSVMLVGVGAFAAAFAVARHMRRRILPRVGPSWEDWLYAEPIGRPWLSFYASAFLACLGCFGFFLPGWVRVGILAALFGFCAPFFTEGVRRRVRARREPDD